MGRRGGNKFSSSGPASVNEGGGSSSQSQPANVDPNAKAAKLFSKLYFETLDNQREKTVHLYGNDCLLLFNGNRYVGGAAINEFWTNTFPPSLHTITNHTFNGTEELGMLIIMHSGNVVCDGKNHMFSQVINCTKEGDQWKILADDYRFMS
uniref:NTF2-related export protein n=1 Tax=Panagrellus redivivus TaxID=6233 RepID=A0A7E4ZZD4_PANRE